MHFFSKVCNFFSLVFYFRMAWFELDPLGTALLDFSLHDVGTRSAGLTPGLHWQVVSVLGHCHVSCLMSMLIWVPLPFMPFPYALVYTELMRPKDVSFWLFPANQRSTFNQDLGDLTSDSVQSSTLQPPHHVKMWIRLWTLESDCHGQHPLRAHEQIIQPLQVMVFTCVKYRQ